MAVIAIYKPGQGKYVRFGTLIALGIFALAGAWWLAVNVLAGVRNNYIIAGAVVAFIVAWGLLGLVLVNRPRLAEFMIMTESEMRKVTWPTRQVVWNSTKVVIMLTLLMAILLFSVDLGFRSLFTAMGLL